LSYNIIFVKDKVIILFITWYTRLYSELNIPHFIEMSS